MSRKAHAKAVSARSPNGDVNTAVSFSLTDDFLPPPEDLDRYEIHHPGITKLLTEAFVAQQQHRMHLEKTVIEGDNRRATRAQALSFAIAMTLIVGGFALFLVGKDGYAIAAFVTAIAPLVAAFFGGSYLRYRERRAKSSNPPQRQ